MNRLEYEDQKLSDRHPYTAQKSYLNYDFNKAQNLNLKY